MRLALLLVLAFGCVEEAVTVKCADGRRCPIGTMCHASLPACVTVPTNGAPDAGPGLDPSVSAAGGGE